MNSKKRKDAEYIGYTFRSDDIDQTSLIKAIEIIENVKLNASLSNSPLSIVNNNVNDKDMSMNKQKGGSNQEIIEFEDISKDIISKEGSNNSKKQIQKIHEIEINGLPKLKEPEKEKEKEEQNKTKLHIITLPKQLKLEKTELKTPTMKIRNYEAKSNKEVSNGNYEENKNNITTNTIQNKSKKNMFFNGLMSMKKSLSFKLKRNKSKSPEKSKEKPPKK